MESPFRGYEIPATLATVVETNVVGVVGGKDKKHNQYIVTVVVSNSNGEVLPLGIELGGAKALYTMLGDAIHDGEIIMAADRN